MSERPCPQRGLERIRPYVPGKPIDEVKRAYGLDDVIKLASNENPLGISPKALDAMRDAVARVSLYPDASSHDLRTAIGRHFGFSIESVGIGSGADDLILQLSMAYLEDGDRVVTSRSSFPIYDIFAHAMRAEMVKTPLTPSYGIDLAAMANAIDERTKLVYVCNPNNPTGTIVRDREVARFLERVPERTIVVFDEAYREMADAADLPKTFDLVREGRPNVVVLRTFSKVYGLAGIRIGYGFAHPDLIATLMRVKAIFNVNVVAQAAGIAALDDEEFLARSVERNRVGRAQLCAGFDCLGLEYAESHTNFVLVRIGPHAEAVQQDLLKVGIIVRPCRGYDLPEFLRITIGTEDQNDRLLTELGRLLAGRKT
jgi:histidinol-phosphate aminotransferase